MKRRIIVSLVVILALVLCAGLIGFNFFRDKMIADFFSKMQPPPQTVAAIEVQRKTWTPGIPAIGTARAQFGVELATQAGGIVRQINFQPDRRFSQGDILVQIDDAVEQADLADAEASLALAQSNLQRTRTLQAKGFTPEATYDQAASQFTSAQARVARLKAVIDQKAIKAPFPGIAGIARVDPGQFIQPGTVVTTFQDLRTMKVDFNVPERAADKVKIGQPVRVGTSEAAMNFSGRVSAMDPRIDPQTRLMSVQAFVSNNKDEAILPGQFLQVRVELPAEPDIVTIPQTAVVSSLYGDYVYVVENDNKDGQTRQVAKQVFVKTGRRDGAMEEVLSGISVGQIIVVAGQNKLQSGSVLTIDNSVDVTKVAEGQKTGAP